MPVRTDPVRPSFRRRLRLGCRRGSAALLGVMFLAFIAITVGSALTVLEHDRRAWDRWRMAGQIFSEWIHAMDGRGDEIRAAIDWTVTPGGGWSGDWAAVRDLQCATPPCPHGHLPISGLGGDASLYSGLYGARIATEAMRFSFVHLPPTSDVSPDDCLSPGSITAPYEEQCLQAGAGVLIPSGPDGRPSPGRLDAIRRGLIDGDLETVAIADANGDLQGPDAIVQQQAWLTHAHRWGTFFAGLTPAPAAGKFPAYAVVAVTYASIPRQERALHRSAPPGRPDLAGMQTDLDMGGPGGRDPLTVMGRDRRDDPDPDRPDVEADNVAGVAQATVDYTPATSDPEPAVRADSVEATSLTLTSTAGPPREAHTIGVRVSGDPDAFDEVLSIAGNATVADAETSCVRQDTGQRCVATETLTGDTLESHGPLQVHTNQTGLSNEDSGVIAREFRANTLNLSGECHGCQHTQF